MNPPFLSCSRRVRRTPFSAQVEAAGVKAYTVYNHMLLPTVFDEIEADYRHLKTHVQVWDVACERQIEIRGRDAQRLVEMMTPRSLTRLDYGKCFYAPLVDDTGGMLNDPVLLKLDDDRLWVSIADSDVLLWAKGLALGLGLDVQVFEADVHPLAVQGQKSTELMARVFGDDVRTLGFFRFRRMRFGTQDLIVARSGYSKQRGFEIYQEGWEHAAALWDALIAAGEDLDVRAGGPNTIERIEGGLLSYGSDMTRDDTPFECGLENFVDLDMVEGCIGHAALKLHVQNGLERQIRGISIGGSPVPLCTMPWPVHVDGRRTGQVTSAMWSPDFETNVSIGMIGSEHWEEGTEVTVETPDGVRPGTVCTLPFSRSA